MERLNGLSHLLSSPSAIATIIVAIVTQVIFTSVYQIRTNDRLESRIEANELAVKDLRTTVKELADRSDTNDKMISGKIESIDLHGTRQMEGIVLTQTRILVNVDKIFERLASVEKSLLEMDVRRLTQLKADTDNLQVAVKKIDERADRIVQALDNTYSLMEEYIKSNPSKTPLKSPSPIR